MRNLSIGHGPSPKSLLQFALVLLGVVLLGSSLGYVFGWIKELADASAFFKSEGVWESLPQSLHATFLVLALVPFTFGLVIMFAALVMCIVLPFVPPWRGDRSWHEEEYYDHPHRPEVGIRI